MVHSKGGFNMEEIKELLKDMWEKQKMQVIFLGAIIVLAIIATFVL